MRPSEPGMSSRFAIVASREHTEEPCPLIQSGTGILPVTSPASTTEDVCPIVRPSSLRRPVSQRDTAYQPRATLWVPPRPSPAFCRNAAYLHPADSSPACRSWWCSRRCGPAIPAESGCQCHSPARASQTHAAASDTSLGAKHHNAGPTQREGVQHYSRAPASRSGARKNPNGPTHRLTLVRHCPGCLHSCQYLFETPRWPLTSNCKCTHGLH